MKYTVKEFFVGNELWYGVFSLCSKEICRTQSLESALGVAQALNKELSSVDNNPLEQPHRLR